MLVLSSVGLVFVVGRHADSPPSKYVVRLTDNLRNTLLTPKHVDVNLPRFPTWDGNIVWQLRPLLYRSQRVGVVARTELSIWAITSGTGKNEACNRMMNHVVDDITRVSCGVCAGFY